MRRHVLHLIDREAEFARAGRPGRIIAKLNALVDTETIEALYRASQAGVEIELIVRGICCLRPRVPGLSDNIRVVSILGRFLEHSRVWYCANDGAAEFYIGSADWMQRNFDRRVELVVPVEDPELHQRLRALLDTCLADTKQAWELAADGTYTKRARMDHEAEGTHEILLRDSWGRNRPQTGRVTAAAD
jgi:polyphosphate kinase